MCKAIGQCLAPAENGSSLGRRVTGARMAANDNHVHEKQMQAALSESYATTTKPQ